MNKFPSGIAVYFRMMAANNQLAVSVHLEGRDVLWDSEDIPPGYFKIVDANGAFLGAYDQEFVAAILPLATQGPGNADNQQN